MKIHVSENTKQLLDQYGGFLLEKRGIVEIKVTSDFFERKNNLQVYSCRAKEPCKLSGCLDTKSCRAMRPHRHCKLKKLLSQFTSLNFFKSFEVTNLPNLMIDCFRCRCSKLISCVSEFFES